MAQLYINKLTYDASEINGMLASNGTVIKTDPNNKYTDPDKLTDGEEMGEYNEEKGCFPCYSNPLDEDTDDDGYDDYNDANPRKVARWTRKYEDMYGEYAEKDVARFEKSSVKDYYDTPNTLIDYYNKDFIEIRDSVYKKGTLVYNLKNNLEYYKSIYNDIEEVITYLEIASIKRSNGTYFFDSESFNSVLMRTYFIDIFSNDSDYYFFQDARCTLSHFLDNTGNQLDLYVDRVLATSVNFNKWFITNEGKLLQHIQDVVKPGHSMIIDTEYHLTATNNKVLNEGLKNILYWPAFGDVRAAIVADVYNNNGIYNVRFRYIMFDNYNWQYKSKAKFAIAMDGDMFAIECCGYGKSYFILGEKEYKYEWQGI